MLLHVLSNKDRMIGVQWFLAHWQRLLNFLVFQVPPNLRGNKHPFGEGVHLSFHLFLLQQPYQRLSSIKKMLSELVWSHSADCLKVPVAELQIVPRLYQDQVRSSWIYFAEEWLVWSKGTIFIFISLHIECFLSFLYSEALTASWNWNS